MAKQKTSGYFARLGRGLKQFAADLVGGFPKRAGSLLQHFATLPDGWTAYMKASAFGKPKAGGKGNAKPASRALYRAGVWTGVLLAKTFDLPALPQLFDLLWQAVKINTRGLTALELAEARKVFGNSLPYSRVRIDELSLIARMGAYFAGAQNMGVATFHTINFTRRIAAAPGNRDMAWLVHELVHVAQMQAAGSRYIGEALHAQRTEGYNYGGPDGLAGKCLADFNREQQGDIVRDYYLDVLHSSDREKAKRLAAVYEPFIADLQKGSL